jgi:hypothetical protein
MSASRPVILGEADAARLKGIAGRGERSDLERHHALALLKLGEGISEYCEIDPKTACNLRMAYLNGN